jgi:hypothetical protein
MSSKIYYFKPIQKTVSFLCNRERTEIDKKVLSKKETKEGECKMNSKRKGKRGELDFAKFCREQGYDVRRGQQYNGLEGEDVVGLPGIHVEVKRVERLNIYDAITQSKRDAQGKIPIVAHRRNNCEWLITMRAEDWFKLYREWEAGNNV